LDQPESENIINVNIEVIVDENDGIATVTVPPELRFTERLVAFLHAAVKERGLELKNWTITTPEQEKELNNLSNVIVEAPQQ
jgi:hypothetical protein